MLIELMLASNKHGLMSDDFKTMLDTQDAFRKLDPVVEIVWPRWMLWERHTQKISIVNDPDQWHSLVSNKALRDKGVAEGDQLLTEQTRLWNEKFAEVLQLDDKENEVLKQYFPQNLDAETTLETIFHFVVSFAVLLRASEFDLEDRIDLLDDAFAVIDEELPNPARRHAGSVLGATLSAFNRGMAVVASARLVLATARCAKSSLDEFKIKMQKFKTSVATVQAQGLSDCSEHLHREMCDHGREGAAFIKGASLDKEFHSDVSTIFHSLGGDDFISLLFTVCLSVLEPLGDERLAGITAVQQWHRPLSSTTVPRIMGASSVFDDFRNLQVMCLSPRIQNTESAINRIAWLDCCVDVASSTALHRFLISAT